MFHDWRAENFPVSQLDAQVVFMTMSEEDCCVVKNEPEGNAILNSWHIQGPLNIFTPFVFKVFSIFPKKFLISKPL